MATIDGKYIMAEKEDMTDDVDITQQPIEKDIDITDHVQRKARTLSISGLIAGENAAEMQRFLVEAQDTGKVVEYIGRTTLKGLLSGFSTSRDYTTGDGYTYSLTITEVRFASSSYVSKLSFPIKSQAAKIINSGVKQTKSNKKTKNKKKKSSSKKKGGQKVQKVKFKPGSPWA